MEEPPFHLGYLERRLVARTCKEVCSHRGWGSIAQHIRSTHVHLVIQAEVAPSRIIGDLKAYSTRSLKRAGIDRKRFWIPGGSKKYLWTETLLSKLAIREVGSTS